MDLANAGRFQELLAPGVSHPHYQYDKIFDDTGFFARAHSKKKFKLLKALDPVLSAMLYEGETVDFLTWGVQSSLIDHFMLGWVMYTLNRSAIVFTSHRVLLLRVDGRGRPRDLVSQIRYDAIAQVKRSLFGATLLVTRSGKKTAFEKVAKPDRKFMQQTLESLQSSGKLESSGVMDREHLCPHCWIPVEGRPEACASCGGEFKSIRGARIRSLIFPGLGDWYLGHRGFAVMEMAGAALAWFSVLGPQRDEFGRPVAYAFWPDTVMTAAMLFAIMHLIDSWFTGRVAAAGIYPGRPPARGEGAAAMA